MADLIPKVAPVNRRVLPRYLPQWGHCLSPALVLVILFLNSDGVNQPSLECGRFSL
jgi:hypothetical protein